jgi:hypothetical protein
MPLFYIKKLFFTNTCLTYVPRGEFLKNWSLTPHLALQTQSVSATQEHIVACTVNHIKHLNTLFNMHSSINAKTCDTLVTTEFYVVDKYRVLVFTKPYFPHSLSARLLHKVSGLSGERGSTQGFSKSAFWIWRRQQSVISYQSQWISHCRIVCSCAIYIYSFSSLSYDRSKASSKTSSPHSAIQSFLLQMIVSSSFLKVIQ